MLEGLLMLLQYFQTLQRLKQMLYSLSESSAGLQTKLATADELLIKPVGLYMDHDKSSDNIIPCSKTLGSALTLHYFIFKKTSCIHSAHNFYGWHGNCLKMC